MPNDIVPTDATGLPSRRAALASLAGLGAALALPEGAEAAARATDPAIADLAARYAAAHRRWVAALTERGEAEERVTDPDAPEALYGRDEEPLPFRSCFVRYLDDGRRWFGEPDVIERLKALGPSHMAWSHPGAAARRVELIAAEEEWSRAIRAAEDAAGLTAAEAEYGAADDELRAIHAHIIRLRSSDPAVRRLKLQLLADALEQPRYLDASIEAELSHRGAVDKAVALSIARDLCSFDQVSA